MNKPLTSTLTLLGLGAAMLLTTQAAMAHDRIDWSVNIGAPVAFAAPPVVYSPNPPVVVYGQPRHVYRAPVQVVEYGRPYYGYGYREREWRERQRREYYYRHHHHYRGYVPYRGEW